MRKIGVLVFILLTTAAFTLRLRFTNSPAATSYRLHVAQGLTPTWSVYDLGFPPTTTPGVHEKDQAVTGLIPGLGRAAVSAHNSTNQSGLSNEVTFVVPTNTSTPTNTLIPTPSVTSSSTRTRTATASPTQTPLQPPVLLECDINGDGLVTRDDANVIMAFVRGKQPTCP